mgnify:CR=1 FL=1
MRGRISYSSLFLSSRLFLSVSLVFELYQVPRLEWIPKSFQIPWLLITSQADDVTVPCLFLSFFFLSLFPFLSLFCPTHFINHVSVCLLGESWVLENFENWLDLRISENLSVGVKEEDKKWETDRYNIFRTWKHFELGIDFEAWKMSRKRGKERRLRHRLLLDIGSRPWKLEKYGSERELWLAFSFNRNGNTSDYILLHIRVAAHFAFQLEIRLGT